MERVRLGTRSSALARWQTDHVIALWRRIEPDLDVEIVDISTLGDDRQDAPLEAMEGTGFFTSTIERALQSKRVDLAVHSFKDLPVAVTAGLTVAAIPARGPVEDALCAPAPTRFADLPPGARVGTSSLRRIAQLRAIRADLEFRPLRGNVPTRVEKVARGELDAVVVARAGLARLGLEERATEIFAVDIVLPAPSQGALAIQARADDAPLLRRLAALEAPDVRRAVVAEREVLHQLRGGCSVPVGAHARVEGATIALDAGVFSIDGTRAPRVRLEGDDPEALGAEAARRLIAAGAGEILEALARVPRMAWERP